MNNQALGDGLLARSGRKGRERKRERKREVAASEWGVFVKRDREKRRGKAVGVGGARIPR